MDGSGVSTRDAMIQLANDIIKVFTHEDARAWNIVAPPHIYTETLALIREFGARGPAPCPVWIFEAAHQPSDNGWLERTREIDRERRTTEGRHPEDAPSPAEARKLFDLCGCHQCRAAFAHAARRNVTDRFSSQ